MGGPDPGRQYGLFSKNYFQFPKQSSNIKFSMNRNTSIAIDVVFNIDPNGKYQNQGYERNQSRSRHFQKKLTQY